MASSVMYCTARSVTKWTVAVWADTKVMQTTCVTCGGACDTDKTSWSMRQQCRSNVCPRVCVQLRRAAGSVCDVMPLRAQTQFECGGQRSVDVSLPPSIASFGRRDGKRSAQLDEIYRRCTHSLLPRSDCSPQPFNTARRRCAGNRAISGS